MQSARERRQRERQREQRAARLRRIALVGTAVLVAVLVTVWAVVASQQTQVADPAGTPSPAGTAAGGSTAPGGAATAPPNATAAGDGIVVFDNPGAPVVGVYSDYQCASCLRFDDSFGAALTVLGQTGEITLVHHTRVFLDAGDAEGRSHRAALAAACADVVGAHGPYSRGIWDAASAGPYTDPLFTETLPKRVGLTGDRLERFRSCYAGRSLAPFVQQVEDLALKAGYTEAPVITVDGRRVPNEAFVGKSGDDLAAIIAEAAGR